MASARLCVAALILIGVAGCTVDTPGQATTPGPTALTTKPSTATTGSSKPAPVRPSEVKIDDVNPCDLLSPAQLQRFAIDKAPSPDTDSTFQTPTCNFLSSSTRTGFRVTPIRSVGIDRFEPGKVNGKVEPRTIRGFPAFQIHVGGASPGNDFCSVTIDVAKGQVVDVSFHEDGSKQPMTTEAVCQKANEGADAVMTTLLAR